MSLYLFPCTLPVPWTAPLAQPPAPLSPLSRCSPRRMCLRAGPTALLDPSSRHLLLQEGSYYAGWITQEIEGPFKGGPGTGGW